MAHALGGGALGPVNGALIVIVESSGSVGVREVHVVAPVLKRQDSLTASSVARILASQVEPLVRG